MSSILSFITNKKGLFALGTLIIGLLLLLYSSFTDNDDDEADKIDTGVNNAILYSEELELKLENFLKTIEGISSAEVFVTVDGGNETEYAGKGDSGRNPSDYLIINKGGGEEAAVVRQVYPRIRGIAVSCTNGNNAGVKENITSLLSAALGISTNKISVSGYGK